MPSVLFVCVANSCRSQMAEAIAKSLAGNRWDIWSAGSHPSGLVHPVAIGAMKELGLDLSGHRSKGLEALPAREWEYVVTMGCGDACDRGGHPAPQAGSPTAGRPRARHSAAAPMATAPGVPNTEGVRPAVAARHRVEWDIPDPVDLPMEEVRRIRDQIVGLVRALIQEETDA